MEKPNRRDPAVTYRVKLTAELTGLTPNAIYKIIRGDRNNESVFETYMEIQERQNELLKAVKNLVPFN